MTAENRELLLSELCARFPYTIYVYMNDKIAKVTEIRFDNRGNVIFTLKDKDKTYIGIDVERVKPYLRPLKSMTPEEKEDYVQTLNIMEDGMGTKLVYTTHYALEWLNEHHFDFRNLIEKGLAIEAPDRLYK